MNQQLVQYIATQRAKGFADNLIESALLAAGWDASVVKSALYNTPSIDAAPVAPSPAPQQTMAVQAQPASVNEPTYRGFWIRFVAYVFDQVIVGFPLVFVLGIMGITDFAPLFIFTLLVTAVYEINFLTSRYQATPGKLLLGIKVTNENGEKLTTGQAVKRLLVKMFLSGIFMIGFISAGFTKKKQAAHDEFAKTVVVTA